MTARNNVGKRLVGPGDASPKATYDLARDARTAYLGLRACR